MADTIQVVLWALGQSCPLRQGADWQQPAVALKALSRFQTYSGLRKREGRGFGVFGDVCVYSVTAALPGEKCPHYDYPSGGFVLSSQFAPYGGLPSLHRLCGDCPANGDPGGIAGCAGSFLPPLYSEDLHEQLERLVDRFGLETKLDSIFPKTRLQWFRFWINSPIPAEGAAVLHQLFEALLEDDSLESKISRRLPPGEREDLSGFLWSLDRSVTANIPLYVSLAPPGHTDLGWFTIFSHCPRCKAEAPVERWKRKYKDEEIECAICGAKYSPARTHSAVRDDFELKDLRELLGQPEFEKFAAHCLMIQGASEPEAMQIVQKHEERERERGEKLARQREFSNQHKGFVEAVIYQGLKNVNPGGGDVPAWLFSPTDAEEILRRCERYGGEALEISHVSESGERDEYVQVTWPTSATRALQKLREQGCNEKFYIRVKIPKEVVEGWANQKED